MILRRIFQILKAGLVKAFGLSGVTANTPDVCGRDGLLIFPGDYGTKITDEDIVEVEVVRQVRGDGKREGLHRILCHNRQKVY